MLSKPRLLRNDDDIGYLLKTMRNLFYDERRQAARRATDPVDPEDFERVAGRSGPEELVEQRELLGGISALPEEFRDVLVAVDVAGLSYKEASSALGVPEGTVMSRLYRARKRVIEAYGRDGPGREAVDVDADRSELDRAEALPARELGELGVRDARAGQHARVARRAPRWRPGGRRRCGRA